MQSTQTARVRTTRPVVRKHKIIDVAAIVGLAAFAAWYISPYLSVPGVPTVVDTPGHFFSVWFLDHAIRNYSVFPAWCDYWYAGFPFLQFYPPLSYVTAASLGLLLGSPLTGFYATIGLTYVLSAWFIYLGSLILFRSRIAGTVAALSYTVSSVLSGWVFFGAFPFVFGSAFLPLVVALCELSLREPSRRNLTLFALTLTCILLSHGSLVAFAILMLGVYAMTRALVCAGLHMSRFGPEFASALETLVLAGLLALSFAAFFYVPFLSQQPYFVASTTAPAVQASLQDPVEVMSLLLERGFEKTGRTYCGIFLAAVAPMPFLSRRLRKHSAAIYLAAMAVTSAFLFGYQQITVAVLGLHWVPFLQLVNTYRYPFVTTLMLSLLSGASALSVLDLLEACAARWRRLNPQLVGFLLIGALVLVNLFDFLPFRTMLFTDVPNAPLKGSNPLYDRLAKDPKYYRVYITFDADPLGLSCSPAIHRREIITGWYLEGSPLRQLVFSNLEWNLVHAERGGLLVPYFETFCVKYFVASDYEAKLKDYFASFGQREFEYVRVDGTRLAYFELKDSPDFATSCVALLHIGRQEDALQLFEAITYAKSDCVLVRGRTASITEYSLEDMLKYDAVLLHGWEAEEEQALEKLLENYVRRGGILFVAPTHTEPFLGMTLYRAESLGVTGKGYSVRTNTAYSKSVFNGVDPTMFAPALYGELPWGYVALKNPTETLMWIDDNPVLAIESIGSGKIVWIGFGLLKHIYWYLNRDEGLLLKNLVEHVLPGSGARKVEKLEIDKRPYGFVDMTLEASDTDSFWILVRECHFPGWTATINGGNAQIHVAEPGLILIKIGGSEHYKVSMRYELTEYHYVGWAVTLLSSFLASVWVVRGGSVKCDRSELRLKGAETEGGSRLENSHR